MDMNSSNQILSHLERLRNNLLSSSFNHYFSTIEKQISVPIEQLTLGSVLVLFICVLVGIGAAMITTIVGFIYPFCETIRIQSLTSSSSSSSSDNNKISTSLWLVYWLMFGSFEFFESMVGSSRLVYWIPFFYPLKLAFFLSCQIPSLQTLEVIRTKILLPIVAANEDAIDSFLSSAAKKE